MVLDAYAFNKGWVIATSLWVVAEPGASVQNDLMPAESYSAPVREELQLSRADAYARGRQLRRTTPRGALAERSTAHRDAVAHIREQNEDRNQELVPLRMERMLENPFAFYRGTAGLMAMDLARDPHSGIVVAACGDAHISNFGFYASPERKLVFDLNDFDEAGAAPWDWDLKRLVTSVVVGGMHAEYTEREVRKAAQGTVRAYRSALTTMLERNPYERYYMHSNIRFARSLLSADAQKVLHHAIRTARKRTNQRAVRRTTQIDHDGRLRFVERPPAMTTAPVQNTDVVPRLFAEYRRTVSLDVRTVLAQYTPTDLARRVVGVGSVGTRCFLQLLQSPDGDALLLQVKEAGQSVLQRYGGIPQPSSSAQDVAAHGQGTRVVQLQRVLQAVSDPFLGHLQNDDRDYYVRQFHDMKGSIDLAGLDFVPFFDYVRTCALLLARAHAQSPAAGQILGYLGKSEAATEAVVDWSFSYARQSLLDYEALRAAH